MKKSLFIKSLKVYPNLKLWIKLLLVGFLLILPAFTFAEYEWELVDTSGPSPRRAHAMAYDSSRNVAVLFGGQVEGGLVGDTWEWDGQNWTLVSTGGPSQRYFHEMVYDSTRKRVVMFGGMRLPGNWNSLSNETWEWDGVNWNLVSQSGPAGRYSHAMAYDAQNEVTVLFGGYDRYYRNQGDTWIWDGNSWTKVSNSGPSPRRHTEMEYDETRGKVVLFSGNHGGGIYKYYSDTWEWDGIGWTRASLEGPHGRTGEVMTWDSDRDVIVLYGGGYYKYVDRFWVFFNETWEWNGESWNYVNIAGPNPVYDMDMVYDRARKQMVLFGGSEDAPYRRFNNETWVYKRSNQSPVAICKNIEIPVNENCQAVITPGNIDGGSYDPDNDQITLAIDNEGPFDKGEHYVTLTVTDSHNESDTCIATVNVKDTTSPTISGVIANPNILWPPNHKMVPVTVNAVVSDNCDASPMTKVISVTSNEPINGTGDGDTAPDWEITGDFTVNLRAEKSGNGNGRIYTVTVESTDADGNSSTQDVTVIVPHNKKKK